MIYGLFNLEMELVFNLSCIMQKEQNNLGIEHKSNYFGRSKHLKEFY
jgi:hypothetical protein